MSKKFEWVQLWVYLTKNKRSLTCIFQSFYPLAISNSKFAGQHSMVTFDNILEGMICSFLEKNIDSPWSHDFVTSCKHENRFMIIRLNLCGVTGRNIRIDLCKLLLYEHDIGKYRFVPNFRSPKIRFGPWHIIFFCTLYRKIHLILIFFLTLTFDWCF